MRKATRNKCIATRSKGIAIRNKKLLIIVSTSFFVTTTKALVTTSDALVTTSKAQCVHVNQPAAHQKVANSSMTVLLVKAILPCTKAGVEVHAI